MKVDSVGLSLSTGGEYLIGGSHGSSFLPKRRPSPVHETPVGALLGDLRGS